MSKDTQKTITATPTARVKGHAILALDSIDCDWKRNCRQDDSGKTHSGEWQSKAFGDLVSSIRTIGILEPIGVVEIPQEKRKNGQTHRLLYGYRRFAAAPHADLKMVPVAIFEPVTADNELLANVAENTVRSNLDTVAMIERVDKLTDHGMSPEQIGNAIGKSLPYVRNILRVAAIEPKVWTLIKAARSESFVTHRNLITLSGYPKNQHMACWEQLCSGTKLEPCNPRTKPGKKDKDIPTEDEVGPAIEGGIATPAQAEMTAAWSAAINDQLLTVIEEGADSKDPNGPEYYRGALDALAWVAGEKKFPWAETASLYLVE